MKARRERHNSVGGFFWVIHPVGIVAGDIATRDWSVTS